MKKIICFLIYIFLSSSFTFFSSNAEVTICPENCQSEVTLMCESSCMKAPRKKLSLQECMSICGEEIHLILMRSNQMDDYMLKVVDEIESINDEY